MKIRKIAYDDINESLYEYSHYSGLKAYVFPKKGFHKKFAAFGTNYGSIDSEFVIPGENGSTKVPDGIAHFLEHKLFEQKDGNVMEKYSAIGASPNAYTSFTQTVYLFSCTERFQEGFNLLLDYVQNPYITEESVEREKGIIGQEIQMYQDDPNWRVYFNLLNALFIDHPTKKDIAGTIDSISHIDRETLYKCFHTFYNPANMVLIAGGDIDHEAVFESIDKQIESQIPRDGIQRIYPKEPNGIHQHYVEQKMEVSIPIFYMGFKDKYRDKKAGVLIEDEGTELLMRDVAMKIILEMVFGKGSTIYNLLYNQGLIDPSFGYDYTIEKDYGYSMIGGESFSPEKVRDIITQELQKLKEAGFRDVDFEITKKMFKGRFVRNLNSVEKPCRGFMSNYFKGVNVFDYYMAYEKIDFEFTKEVFLDHFDENMLALSVVKGR
jgi:predicted Zn-dependent peptidase